MSALPLDEQFEYPTYDVCVEAEHQADKLACCDIDPDIYAGYVDVTHFAMETILAAKRGGASINGSVHVSQTFKLQEPIRLGETVTMAGDVTHVEQGPRGALVTSRFTVTRPDGSQPLILERVSLRADPDRMDSGPRKPKPVAAPPEMTLVSSHQLVPDQVARYSDEAKNLIHSDPEVARQFGFKAPIAGGLMAVRFMLAFLHQQGTVRELDMHVRFKRPMFWDDELLLHESVGTPRQLVMLRGSDGKVANDAVVSAVAY